MRVRVGDSEEEGLCRLSDESLAHFSHLVHVAILKADEVGIIPPHVDGKILFRIHMELAHQSGAIALVLQQAEEIREGFVLGVVVCRQTDLATLVRVEAGEDARTPGATNGLGRAGVGEADALGGKPVDVGGRNVGIAVTTQMLAVVL